MKLIQIYLDDETHTILVKNYTIALAAAEESFTFEEYLLYLLQAVSPCLPTHAVQPPEIKEKTITLDMYQTFCKQSELCVQRFWTPAR
jgi:hypothetical protein